LDFILAGQMPSAKTAAKEPVKGITKDPSPPAHPAPPEARLRPSKLVLARPRNFSPFPVESSTNASTCESMQRVARETWRAPTCKMLMIFLKIVGAIQTTRCVEKPAWLAVFWSGVCALTAIGKQGCSVRLPEELLEGHVIAL